MDNKYFYPIKHFEDSYAINCEGKVKNIKTQKILKADNNKGYLRVSLSKNNIVKRYLVHRLVAQTFIENKYNKKYVNHIDGNKINNNVKNLEWVTASENELHSYKYLNKINPQKKLILNAEYGIFYDSIEEAAQSIGKKHTTISAMLTGQNKNTTSLIYAT
jgi:hypothetical protein